MSQVTGITCPICGKGCIVIDALNGSGKSIESAELSVDMYGEVEFYGFEDKVGTADEWKSTTAMCPKCKANFKVTEENCINWVNADETKAYRVGKWKTV